MKLESRPVGNLALNLGALVAGALLMWLARDFRHGGSNELAGFLLGCLLFGLGAASFAIGESRTVELDERNKKIVLQVRRRIGSCRRVEIPFRCITGVGVAALGSTSDGSRYYDLVISQNTGRDIHLFGGCVFEGRMSRDWIDGLRSHFQHVIGLP